jgi:hypothetical protein
MPKVFIKTKECGCVVEAIICGQKNGMYMLGGHSHMVCCATCLRLEERTEDTLYDMWQNDNMTDNFEYANWKLYVRTQATEKNMQS